MGVKAGSLESKVLYGLRPRRKGVTILSIRLPNFTFFKIALHNKVLITYFLGGELQKLIGSQRQHSEHQMRHDLARAPHADLPSSKLILQATIHSLDQSETAVVHNLQQDVEDVGMRLFDLVEKHDRVRMTPHLFGKLPALVVADVSRRRANQARDGVLLHVFGHVDRSEEH